MIHLEFRAFERHRELITKTVRAIKMAFGPEISIDMQIQHGDEDACNPVVKMFGSFDAYDECLTSDEVQALRTQKLSSLRNLLNTHLYHASRAVTLLEDAECTVGLLTNDSLAKRHVAA